METQREIPVFGKYDVIVVGGGPAGCGAAIAAARAGAKVLLCEQQNCLGGMWTAGFVNPLFDSEGKSGLILEIIEGLKKQNVWGGFWNISFHYEYMKTLLEKKCTDAGVDVLFETSCIGALKEKNRVFGIRTHNIDGIGDYFGKIVIDASGDASVAADAGVPFSFGDDVTHSCQAMTLMFLVGNIPEKYRNGYMIRDIVDAVYEKEGLGRKSPFNQPCLIPIPNSDFAVIQLTHMRGYSALSQSDRSKAVMEGRRQMIDVFELLKKYDPDFKDLMLLQSAPLLGVRESRRIHGEYTLTDENILNGTHFEDGVCTVRYNADIHEDKGTHQTCIFIKPYQVPYRCMIPYGFEGLLVAGRTISGSRRAMASYRVTADCCCMGEAAGKAAAYAAAHDGMVRNVPIELIREPQ